MFLLKVFAQMSPQKVFQVVYNEIWFSILSRKLGGGGGGNNVPWMLMTLAYAVKSSQVISEMTGFTASGIRYSPFTPPRAQFLASEGEDSLW